MRLVPLDSKREVKLSSRLKNAGVKESIALLFLSMMYYVTHTCVCICILIHTGYSIVSRQSRELVQSPGKRIHLANSDRFKQSLLKNEVRGVRQARKDLKWNHIELPKIKKLKSEIKKTPENFRLRSQVTEQQSKHTSKRFVDVTDMSSRYVTCLSHLKQFVSEIASSCPCASVSSDGHARGQAF